MALSPLSPAATQEEPIVGLHAYVDFLRRRWLSIAVTTSVIYALASLATLVMPREFTAETQLLLGGGGDSPSEVVEGSTLAEQQMSSYAELAKSPLVLDPVIRRLELPERAEKLQDAVQVSVPTDTLILDIAVTDPHPEKAARIANAIRLEFGMAISEMSPTGKDGSRTLRVTTMASATVPDKPSSPPVLRNLALGLIVGLLLGIAVGVVRHALARSGQPHAPPQPTPVDHKPSR
jgi:succinoglycan biosynthesis transport protein ExoP